MYGICLPLYRFSYDLTLPPMISLEAGKSADLLVVKGDVARDIHALTPDAMEVIMKGGDIVIKGAL